MNFETAAPVRETIKPFYSFYLHEYLMLVERIYQYLPTKNVASSVVLSRDASSIISSFFLFSVIVRERVVSRKTVVGDLTFGLPERLSSSESS